MFFAPVCCGFALYILKMCVFFSQLWMHFHTKTKAIGYKEQANKMKKVEYTMIYVNRNVFFIPFFNKFNLLPLSDLFFSSPCSSSFTFLLGGWTILGRKFFFIRHEYFKYFLRLQYWCWRNWRKIGQKKKYEENEGHEWINILEPNMNPERTHIFKNLNEDKFLNKFK